MYERRSPPPGDCSDGGPGRKPGAARPLADPAPAEHQDEHRYEARIYQHASKGKTGDGKRRMGSQILILRSRGKRAAGREEEHEERSRREKK